MIYGIKKRKIFFRVQGTEGNHAKPNNTSTEDGGRPKTTLGGQKLDDSKLDGENNANSNNANSNNANSNNANSNNANIIPKKSIIMAANANTGGEEEVAEQLRELLGVFFFFNNDFFGGFL